MNAGSPFESIASRGGRRKRTSIALAIVVIAAAAAITLALLPDDHDAPRAALASVATSHRCPTTAAAARAQRALTAAEARYELEAHGRVTHIDLRQVAEDPRLLAALAAGDPSAALVAANRQLVRHVVQISVVRRSHVLVDANAPSFDVAGPRMSLRAGGRYLGVLHITLQDVIGYIKLVHKLDHAQVVVRSPTQMRTSLPAAGRAALPLAGCATIGTHTYVVGSFARKSFAGEPLTIRVLTPAG